MCGEGKLRHHATQKHSRMKVLRGHDELLVASGDRDVLALTVNLVSFACFW
jgi:hypothetical protein